MIFGSKWIYYIHFLKLKTEYIRVCMSTAKNQIAYITLFKTEKWIRDLKLKK